MVRKQVYLRADQDRRLAEMAAQRSVSEAQILREAVDRLLDDRGQAAADALWEEHIAWVEERARSASRAAGTLRYTRDELHER
jgi:hypothetical protein